MNGNSITINPAKPTEVFLLLHERANRPSELEFEYMTGKLRDQLEERRYGPALAEEGVARAERLGTCFKGAKVKRIFTDSFVTALETAKAVARAAGLDPATQVTHDMRIRESDLSYLSKARFTELGALEQGENPNATLRDWMDSCPNDFRSLVSAHLSLWNDLMIKEAGNSFAMVLHVEGVLLLTSLLLGLEAQHMSRLHIPRGCPVHVRLGPSSEPVLSIADEQFWVVRPLTPFGQYR